MILESGMYHAMSADFEVSVIPTPTPTLDHPMPYDWVVMVRDGRYQYFTDHSWHRSLRGANEAAHTLFYERIWRHAE